MLIFVGNRYLIPKPIPGAAQQGYVPFRQFLPALL